MKIVLKFISAIMISMLLLSACGSETDQAVAIDKNAIHERAEQSYQSLNNELGR